MTLQLGFLGVGKAKAGREAVRMKVKIKMPDLGTTEAKIKVLKWLVLVGQEVKRGQALLEVETDKAAMEVESFGGGTLAEVVAQPEDEEEELLEVTLYDLTEAFRGVLRFIGDGLVHEIEGEQHSIDEKVEDIQQQLGQHGSVAWTDLFKQCRSRMELVCCFLAILELCRMGQVRANQHRAFGEIRLFAVKESAPA